MHFHTHTHINIIRCESFAARGVSTCRKKAAFSVIISGDDEACCMISSSTINGWIQTKTRKPSFARNPPLHHAGPSRKCAVTLKATTIRNGESSIALAQKKGTPWTLATASIQASHAIGVSMTRTSCRRRRMTNGRSVAAAQRRACLCTQIAARVARRKEACAAWRRSAQPRAWLCTQVAARVTRRKEACVAWRSSAQRRACLCILIAAECIVARQRFSINLVENAWLVERAVIPHPITPIAG